MTNHTTTLADLAPIADQFTLTSRGFEGKVCEAIKRGYFVIILTEHTTHWVSRAIVWRTKKHKEHEGYSHVMVGHDTYRGLADPRLLRASVASQDWLLSERALSDYLEGKHRLKAWIIEPGPQWETLEWIAQQVDRPWYRRRYDWIGVVGQAIGIPWLNVPWSDYCSEFVGAAVHHHVRLGVMGRHPNPNDINRALKKTASWLPFEPRVLCRYDPTISSDTIIKAQQRNERRI